MKRLSWRAKIKQRHNKQSVNKQMIMGKFIKNKQSQLHANCQVFLLLLLAQPSYPQSCQPITLTFINPALRALLFIYHFNLATLLST
jgi:hypothetical protein